MIGLAVAGRVCRHIGEHDVSPAAKHRLEFCRRLVVKKIKLQEIDAGDRGHVEQIDRHHAAPALARADALRRDLAPAPGRGAEIDHART